MKKDRTSDRSRLSQCRSRLQRTFCRALSGCCLLAAMALTAHAQPLTFTTFAGPSGGAGSADGTGSDARFNSPIGVATDSAGNLYVADSSNHTIRRITPAGIVTSFAGLAGVSGSADGTGSAARFDDPTGVATDKDGNVYVADMDNNTIRKITPKRVVTTLAGLAGRNLFGSDDGTGSAARFIQPTGVATDKDGNVYVADSGNSAIRKITPAGVVTTLAGSARLLGSEDGTGSAARFSNTLGVATDTAGNVYVADTFGRRIRKITPAGVVTTLDRSGGFRSSATGTDVARFVRPFGVAIDSMGNIYVVDSGDSTISKITPEGVRSTLAPLEDKGARSGNPQALAIGKDGNLYVSDSVDHTILKVTPAGVVTILAGSPSLSGSTDGSGSAARFKHPTGMAADKDGNLYVADADNKTIRKITPAGVVTTFAGSAGHSGSQDGSGSTARFSNPKGLAIDSSGNLYVADASNSTIRKITPEGMVTTVAGSAGLEGSEDGTGSAARFKFANAVATDSAGNVYVADVENMTIRKITPAGVVTTLAGSAGLEGGEDGTGSAASFNSPNGVATDKDGNVYVADTSNDTIRKITPAAVVTTLAGSEGHSGSADGTGSTARFNRPSGVATDSSGNVYVADEWNRTIRKITPAGVVTTPAGSAGRDDSADGTGSIARFHDPFGVAIDRDGNVYVVDSHTIRVGKPALADVATIDEPTDVGIKRQLDTSPQTATSWQWRIIRQPSGSTAALSSTSVRNPRFTPDVADLYIFQLTATQGEKTSITTVSLTATAAAPVKPKKSAVRKSP